MVKIDFGKLADLVIYLYDNRRFGNNAATIAKKLNYNNPDEVHNEDMPILISIDAGKLPMPNQRNYDLTDSMRVFVKENYAKNKIEAELKRLHEQKYGPKRAKRVEMLIVASLAVIASILSVYSAYQSNTLWTAGGIGAVIACGFTLHALMRNS